MSAYAIPSHSIHLVYCTAALCNSLQDIIKSECCLLHSKSELGNLLVGVLRPDMEGSFLHLKGNWGINTGNQGKIGITQRSQDSEKFVLAYNLLFWDFKVIQVLMFVGCGIKFSQLGIARKVNQSPKVELMSTLFFSRFFYPPF